MKSTRGSEESLPFAWAAFHWNSTELALEIGTLAIGTALDSGFIRGIAPNLYRLVSSTSLTMPTELEELTFFRLHSSHALDTFERFRRALCSP
jgi:hypothetical protein